MSIEMLVREIPEMPAEELYLRYDQDAGFVVGPEMAALITELQAMPPQDLEMLGDDPVAVIGMARTIMSDMMLGLDIDIEMSGELAALLSEEVREDIGMDLPTEFSLRLMIVDGIFYADTTSIAPYVPEIALFVNGWVGLDLDPVLAMAEAEIAAEEGAGSSMAVSSGGAMGSGSFGMSGAAVTLVDMLDPTGEAIAFMNVESWEADSASENEALFRTTINYNDFFQSPLFRQLVILINADQGTTMTEAELDELVTLAQIMGPSLLQGLELDLVEAVGRENGYLLGSNLLLEWDLKSLLTLAAQGEPSLRLSPEAAPFLGLQIISSADQLNEAVELEAPADAFVLPTEMVMGFLTQ